MQKQDIEEQLERLCERYAWRNKAGRSRMLDELCEQYGYSRKHAINKQATDGTLFYLHGVERHNVVEQLLPSHNKWQTCPPPEPNRTRKSFMATRSWP